ncbi:hybrid sensor histidine kinase/response regulator [Herbaspirillum autotrophicum]|uniref:hybrid sensor histidine kinase/response regulator n=1 Tax=Herbaspirillum autotrophicum TaxID=180195 RepID=UPI00067B22B5|nr:PAS domain-containing sensor histidine kinase [Herbaspirillum autotrophicum]
MPIDVPIEERILILAPQGRDADVIRQTLSQHGLNCLICAGYAELMQQLHIGAGAALITEEGFNGADFSLLHQWLEKQESWSDFPFVILSARQSGQNRHPALDVLEHLVNMILLERPINAETLLRASVSALRARRRQYLSRRHLQEGARSEEHLRLALNAGQLGSWSLELATSVLQVSATCKRHFGFSEDSEFTYDDLLHAIHPNDRQRHRDVIETAVASSKDFSIEYQVLWPDQSVHWIQIRGQTVLNRIGIPVRMAGISLDISDRREAENHLLENQSALRRFNDTLELRIQERTSELAQANDRLMREMAERERTQIALMQAQKMEAIGRLTGGIAHDFNNLLNVIIGNVDLIERLADNERIKRMANSARNATKRGAKLTGQLLAFSRNQSLDLKPVEIESLVEGMKDLIAVSVGANIHVTFEIAPGLPRAVADLNQLEMAILNLAINARDAMADGGNLQIIVSLRDAADGILTSGTYVVIAVKDSGSGIPQEILGKVFDPFFTTKPVDKGTGLGLSQVYGIANQSGGLARIDSTVGKGTTVEVWLPVASVEAVPAPDPQSQELQLPLKESGNILVIEDDNEVRQFIVESLEILGYAVQHAENGWFGLEKLQHENFDLMIVDFLMPGMNGAEVIAAVRERYPHLPIIMATGYADMQAVEKVIGLDAVLRKPFQISDLAGSVKRALNANHPGNGKSPSAH